MEIELAPHLKERAVAIKKEKQEDTEETRRYFEELNKKPLLWSKPEGTEESYGLDEPNNIHDEIADARDDIQNKLDNDLIKSVRKTGRAPRGSIKNAHIPLNDPSA